MATANATNEKMTLDRNDGSATLDLYRAALGPLRTDYYLKTFTRFDAVGKPGPSWNWSAALLSLNWMLFHKLWIAALAYAGAVAGAALLLPGIGGLVFQLSTQTQGALLALTLLLSVAVPGAYGNTWLYAASNKNMARALTASATLEEACALLTRQASGMRRLGSLAGLNVALCAFLAAFALSFPDGSALPAHTSPVTLARAAGPAQSGLASQSVEAASAAGPAMAAPKAAASDSAQAATPAPAPVQVAPLPAAPASQGSGLRSSQGMVQAGAAAAAALTQPAALAAPAPVAASTPQAGPEPLPAAKKTARALLREKAAQADKLAKAKKVEKARAARAAAKALPEKAPAPASAPATETYLINVGLFADANNARNAFAKLQDANLPALSQEIQSNKGARTRIRVGPFESQAEADRAAEKIRSLHLDAAIFKP